MKGTPMLDSSDRNAVIRAVQGEFNVSNILHVLDDERMARLIALAPDAHHVIRAIAALFSPPLALLDASTIADPAFHDAVAWMIRTLKERRDVFGSLARGVPAGWGAIHTRAIIAAVEKKECNSEAAAALIGPCDSSAALLRYPDDIAFAVSRWGQATPETPTAWVNALSSGERNRLLHEIRRAPFAAASCLPWLPPNSTAQIKIYTNDLANAIKSFAVASPFARALHADLVRRLVAHASPAHLSELTLLACAMQQDEVCARTLAPAHDHSFSGHRGFAARVQTLLARTYSRTHRSDANEVWDRVLTLIHESPDAAVAVVTAAPWNDVPPAVRTAILERADSDICTAIAAAQGHKVVTRITNDTAPAFFAALDPKVWDALPSAEQRQWLDALREKQRHLAVRSLGLRPECLARAWLDDNLVRTVRRYAPDTITFCWALFPIALRIIPPGIVHALITALPTPPPDPGAFFCVASRNTDPSKIASARTTLHTRAGLARAVALLRSADRNADIRDRCAALRDALDKWTWNDLMPILEFLDDDARVALAPDIDELVNRLARPDRQIEMRQALARLESLPPEIAVPTVVALSQRNLGGTMEAAEAIADALRAHGDLFLIIVDSLKDVDLRNALLLPPDDAALANALYDVARDDPLSAHRLAHALSGQKWRAALHALLTAPPSANAVWQALEDDACRAIFAEVNAAHQKDDPMIARDPIIALALAATQSDDINLRDAGNVALATRPDVLRAIWSALPHDVQQRLREIPALADLSNSAPPVNRGMLRR